MLCASLLCTASCLFETKLFLHVSACEHNTKPMSDIQLRLLVESLVCLHTSVASKTSCVLAHKGPLITCRKAGVSVVSVYHWNNGHGLEYNYCLLNLKIVCILTNVRMLLSIADAELADAHCTIRMLHVQFGCCSDARCAIWMMCVYFDIRILQCVDLELRMLRCLTV